MDESAAVHNIYCTESYIISYYNISSFTSYCVWKCDFIMHMHKISYDILCTPLSTKYYDISSYISYTLIF